MERHHPKRENLLYIKIKIIAFIINFGGKNIDVNPERGPLYLKYLIYSIAVQVEGLIIAYLMKKYK